MMYIGILSWRHMLCNGEDDETTLLQLHTRVQGHQLPVKQYLDHKMLLESVKTMARHITTESPEVVNAAIASVTDALGQMKPLLVAEHANVQTQIQRQVEEISACHASTSHGGVVVTNLATELAVIDQCRLDVAAATLYRDTTCLAWRNHANILSFPPCLVPDNNPEHIYSVAQTTRIWIDDAWPVMETLRSACNQAQLDLDGVLGTCGTTTDYDETFCAHQLSCTLLSACHNHEVQVYNTMRTDSAVAMASRQDQFRTIRQAECIIDLITSAMSANSTVLDASLSTCDDDIDVSHLVLSYPDAEVLPPCPAPQAGHPQCPAVDLPDAWTGGESTAPVVDPLQGCGGLLDTGGWQLVRHVPAGNRWHPSSDALAGTDTYGDPAGGSLSTVAWTVPWDSNAFNQFLFATGDCDRWLIASKDAVIGAHYANSDRQILMSSTNPNPYMARWYNRAGCVEDPWISLEDHGPAIGNGKIIYGENGFGSTHAAAILPSHQGANVFVRNA